MRRSWYFAAAVAVALLVAVPIVSAQSTLTADDYKRLDLGNHFANVKAKPVILRADQMTAATLGAATLADLASTDNGEGASLIGLEDAGGFFGASANIEAALQLVGPTMTDARVPTAHVLTHATGGGDDLTPSAIGAATASDLDALEAKTAPYLLPVLAAWDPTDVGAGVVDPPTANDGDRYLCSASEAPYVKDRIYQYDDGTSTWSYEAPAAGYYSYNVATTTGIVYDGTNWGPVGTSLPGLTATAAEINAVADVSATGAVTRWIKCTMTDKTAGAHALGCTLPASAYILHDIAFVIATPESSGTTTVDVGTAGDGSLLVDALSVAAAGVKRPTITVTEGATETYVSGKDCGAGLCDAAAGSDSAGDTGLAVWHPYVNATPDALVYTVPAGGWTEFAGYALVQVTEIAP